MASSLSLVISFVSTIAFIIPQPVELQTGPKKITCTDKYADMSDHTMCLPDNPFASAREVSPEDKELIVNLHNKLRAGVKPSPTDMLLMVWDENLAVIADKWSRQCVVGHDSGKSRAVPGYGVSVGQNVAGGYVDWEKAILAWYSEVSIFTYGVKVPNFNKAGHYIQLVHNTTTRVGCGYAECTGATYKLYYVCNYALGTARRGGYPYTAGKSCADCPNNCNQGLCDCAGKLCFNGGKLDPATCTCTCRSIYEGPTCDNLICPEKDNVYCGTGLTVEACVKFPTSRFICPYMCGLCGQEAKESSTLPTLNRAGFIKMGIKPNPPIVLTPPTTTVSGPMFVSAYNCTFRGERPNTEKCMKYGQKGLDRAVCSSVGGTIYSCDDCQYLAIRTRHCPVMCGTCDPPCEGKTCKNGGQLDTSTCDCECKGGFSGKTCARPPCNGRTCNNGGKMDTKKCICSCPVEFAGKYCGNHKCGGRSCKNDGVMDYKTCKCKCKGLYSGKYCGIAPCNGAKCSNGGKMDFKKCTCQCPRAFTGRYCNAERCGGRKCSNGGRMLLETCKCRCVNNYQGKYCNKFVCPTKDKWRCRKMTVVNCSEGVTSDECPYLCGRCNVKRSLSTKNS